jgi:phosphatidylglycerol lysyltransferase
MLERMRKVLPGVVGLLLVVVAVAVLRGELRSVSWAEVKLDVAALPRAQLTFAIGLTVLNYVVLTGYDLIAFAYTGRKLPRLRIALTSLLAYGVANSVGLAMLSGASIRHRFYTRWGVTGEELSRIVFSYSVTFWLGLLALGGLSLAMAPLAGVAPRSLGELARPTGCALMLTPAAYVFGTTIRQRPLHLWRLELPIPPPLIALSQLLLSCLDWVLAGAVLFVLLPTSSLKFLPFLAVFLIAILLGLASNLPGGIGVFETVILLLLKPYFPSNQIVPALVMYRFIYYVGPLTVALIALVVDELHQQRAHAKRVSVLLGQATEQVMPRVLAPVTFLAGLILLFSGATPAAPGRLALIGRVLPVGVVEAPAGQRLLRRCPAGRYRDRRLVVEGLRLRRSNPAVHPADRIVASATSLFETGSIFRCSLFSGLACWDRWCGGGVSLARLLCIQARAVFD